MKLHFEGQAATSAGGINFAAHYTDDFGRGHYLICRITKEAVLSLSGGWHTDPADLLSAFQDVRDQIEKLAYAQFASGIQRPHITTHDIPRAWVSLGQKTLRAG